MREVGLSIVKRICFKWENLAATIVSQQKLWKGFLTCCSELVVNFLLFLVPGLTGTKMSASEEVCDLINDCEYCHGMGLFTCMYLAKLIYFAAFHLAQESLL